MLTTADLLERRADFDWIFYPALNLNSSSNIHDPSNFSLCRIRLLAFYWLYGLLDYIQFISWFGLRFPRTKRQFCVLEQSKTPPDKKNLSLPLPPSMPGQLVLPNRFGGEVWQSFAENERTEPTNHFVATNTSLLVLVWQVQTSNWQKQHNTFIVCKATWFGDKE